MAENKTTPKKNTKATNTSEVKETVDQPESTKYTKVDPNVKKPQVSDSKEVIENMQDPTKRKPILPGKTFKDIQQLAKDVEELSDEEKEKFENEFENTVGIMNYGISKIPSNTEDVYVDRINSKDSNFVNSLVNSDNKSINIRTLKATDINTDKASQGLLLKQFMSLMGKGETVNIPLWHSGFRIVVTPFTTADMITLDSKINQDVINLGRESMGYVLSNDFLIFNKNFLDILYDHIESTTLDIDITEEDIFEYISILDLNIIYLSVITSLYNDGMDITTVCKETSTIVDGKPVCNFSVSGKLDPSKLLWVDYDRLNKLMIKQMSTFNNKRISKVDVKKYQEEVFKYSSDSKVLPIETPNMDIKTEYVFKIPTIREYLTDGDEWLVEMTDNINTSLTKDKSPDERNAIVNAVKNLQILGTYSSYLDRISIGDKDIKERQYLLKAMINRDKSPKAKEDILKTMRAIAKYIEDSSLAIVAIPSYTCPVCEKEQNVTITSRLDYFIPIEVSTLFFELNAQHLALSMEA